ncbi:MAG: hypothetical protein AB7E49_08875 [Campylobacterales bacterium]
MAKPNYSWEKRQRDLAKQKKQEEKLAKKRQKKEGGEEAASDEADKPSEESGE